MEDAFNPWNFPLPLPADRPLQRLFAWLDDVGFDINPRALHERHPEVGWRSFERWAAAQAWPAA